MLHKAIRTGWYVGTIARALSVRSARSAHERMGCDIVRDRCSSSLRGGGMKNAFKAIESTGTVVKI